MILLVILEVALMQQLQADEEWYLRREELSGVRGTCYQDGGGAIRRNSISRIAAFLP